MDLKVDFEYREMAFNKRMLTFAIVNRDHIDIKEFLFDAFNYYENEIKDIFRDHAMVKVNTCFSATFEKNVVQNGVREEDRMDTDLNDDLMDVDGDNATGQVEKKEKQLLYLHTKSVVIDHLTDLYEIYEKTVIDVILNKIDDAIIGIHTTLRLLDSSHINEPRSANWCKNM